MPSSNNRASETMTVLVLCAVLCVFLVFQCLRFSNAQTGDKKVRETVALLEETFYLQRAQGKLAYGSHYNLYINLIGTLHEVNHGETAANLPGAPLQDFSDDPVDKAYHPCLAYAPNGWFLLPNHVVITGLATGADFDMLPYQDVRHNQDQNYVLCLDMNGRHAPNAPGYDIFFGNFNLYGGFTGPPTTDKTSSFYWGTPTTPIYAVGGGPGTPLGNGTCPDSIGCPDNTPSAVAGLKLLH